MTKILFGGGILLYALWAVGFFWFHIGGLIHILHLMAVVALATRLLYNKSVMQ